MQTTLLCAHDLPVPSQLGRAMSKRGLGQWKPWTAVLSSPSILEAPEGYPSRRSSYKMTEALQAWVLSDCGAELPFLKPRGAQSCLCLPSALCLRGFSN